MWKLLVKINKNLIYAIPLLMVGGFCFGVAFDAGIVKGLKQLIMPLTFLMVYPVMVTLNIKHLQQGLKNVKLQFLAQVINFGIIPFVAFGLGKWFFADQPYLALGLLLAALLPTSGMTISWTGFAKGNMGAAINMTVIGLTLGSLATPFCVQGLLGEAVDVNMVQVIKQIVYIVFIPMVLGFLTRTALLQKYTMVEFEKSIAPRFPAMSTIGVLGIVFVAMALKAKTVMADPAILGSIFIPLLIIYTLNYVLSTVLGKMFFARGDATLPLSMVQ